MIIVELNSSTKLGFESQDEVEQLMHILSSAISLEERDWRSNKWTVSKSGISLTIHYVRPQQIEVPEELAVIVKHRSKTNDEDTKTEVA